MKISIAMASYNGAKHIEEQLESFINQTVQPDELIITDDCSTDNTEALVRNFAEKAPFPVFFYRNDENLGYCGNFNAALMKCTGDIVFLSDQDDVWFAEKIERIINNANDPANSDMLMFMNDAELTDADLRSVNLTKIEQIESAGFSLGNFVMGCCSAVRRELLDLCLPIPSEYKSHDNWIARFAEALDAKHVDRTVLQYYRRHETNESHFIANRTSKVGRLQSAKYRIKGSLNRSSSSLENQVYQLQLLCSAMESRAEKAPKAQSVSLLSKVLQNKRTIEMQKKRIELRKQRLPSRVILAFKYLVSGEYTKVNGLKSCIRDVVGD